MIKKLLLENWKTHERSEFNFEKGTNILIGRMGAGKTSVMEAVCFALYGTYPKLSRKEQAIEDLIMHTKSFARVSLLFEKDGHEYLVERKIGEKTEASIRVDGQLVQKGQKAVTDYIASVLGVDYDLFTRAIYSEQNKIDYFLLLSPRERKEEIDWLLGLGKFEEAREQAQVVLGKLSEQAEFYLSEYSEEKINEKKKKIDEIKLQLDQKTKIIEDLEKALRFVLDSYLKEKAEFEKFEKLKKEFEGLRLKIERESGLYSRLLSESNQKQKPTKEEINEMEKQKSQIEEKILSLKKQEKEIQTKFLSSKSRLEVLQLKQKEIEKSEQKILEIKERMNKLTGGEEISKVKEKEQELLEKLDSDSIKYAEINSEIKQLFDAIEKLQKALTENKITTCPVCDSDLSGGKAAKIKEEKEKLLAEKKKQAKTLLDSIEKQKIEKELLKKAILDYELLQKELERQSSIISEKETIKKEQETLYNYLEDIEKEKSEIENQINNSQNSLLEKKEKLNELIKTEKLFEELEISKKTLSELQSRLSALSFDEENYNKSLKKLEEIQIEKTRLETNIKAEKNQLEIILQNFEAEKKAMEELEKKHLIGKKYKQAAESMVILKNTLSFVQSELRRILISEINQALSEIWPAVYPYKDYTGVKIEAGEKDYQLLMYKDGWKEVETIASGGERACFCLSLRIAFASVLTPELSWLILDEPTHNLDEQAVELLSDAIRLKIPSIVEQIFVITHDSLFGQGSQGVIFMLEREKSKGEPSKILTKENIL